MFIDAAKAQGLRDVANILGQRHHSHNILNAPQLTIGFSV